VPRDLAGLCALPGGVCLDVGGGFVYWTDRLNRVIHRADLDGGNVVDLVRQNLGRPEGIALDRSSGKLYWTDPAAGKIQRSNADGSSIDDLVTTDLTQPFRIAIDPVGEKLYWTDPLTGVIERANLDGTGREDFLTGLDRPRGVGVDPIGGKLYWSQMGLQGVRRFNLDGTGTIESFRFFRNLPCAGDLSVNPDARTVSWLVAVCDPEGSIPIEWRVVIRSLDDTTLRGFFILNDADPVGLAVAEIGGNLFAYYTDVRTGVLARLSGLYGDPPEVLLSMCKVLDLQVSSINNTGDVTGFFSHYLEPDAAFILQRGQFTTVETLTQPVRYSDADNRGMAINNKGEIVGISDVGPVVPHNRNSFRDHAFFFGPTGLKDLGTLDADNSFSYAFDLNDRNEIVGYAYAGIAPYQLTRAFRYFNGFMSDLGTLGGRNSHAFGINDAGDIVGRAETSNGEVHAFLHDGRTMIDLGTLGGPFSQANDIDASGRVVGESWTADGERHAFLYDEDEMEDIGTLGGEESRALAINASGMVVGESITAKGDIHAFVYRDGTMTDLNDFLAPDMIWDELLCAVDINDRGQIVGLGEAGGLLRSFILTPTVRGDMNCDDEIDMADVAPFVLALVDPNAYVAAFAGCAAGVGDMNRDLTVNGEDVAAFVERLVDDELEYSEEDD